MDLDLPQGKLIAITGVSGSGKSSLAHDVIHAAGQRRYLEVLSSHARRCLLRLDRPELDHAQGLRPAVAVDQRTAATPGAASSRSTVGLHLQDIQGLLRLMDELIMAGHTLLVVEHHPVIIQAAHWQLELGPGSGENGGRIMSAP